MIPNYPVFAPISLAHKDAVKHFTNQYDPYSDFDFTSLFCWNIDGSTEISQLNNNMVIKLPHYIHGQPCFSILGHKQIDDSLTTLLNRHTRLEFVPEVVIEHVKKPARFEIREDPDHYDYIYALEDHATFPGKKFKDKRKALSKFARTHDNITSVRQINFANQAQILQLEQTFLGWSKQAKNPTGTIAEAAAIKRLVESANQLKLLGFELLANEKVIGFSIVEIVHKGYVVFHFHKVHTHEPGADAFLTQQVSKYLHEQGCSLINWEQDLGIEGLRHSKTRYRPIKMLKKYQVSYANP